VPSPQRSYRVRQVSPQTRTNRPSTEGNVMKQMILTGLATDQRFGKPDPDFFLVFNNGELRVPVTQEAAEVVVQTMYGSNGAPPPPTVVERDEDDLHTDPDDDGIPQA
jgi:hypothetical protein